ncbi:uncharacterized protein LOC133384397 isoform X2 [Rhineura floridana]|uniref:uncharacterized protein LOC133384397 isoform X2 n=1 Tax=Rhineura floridana TaxID=261503 RepID=UPI002AC81DD4|nr:uncharacterized protein LOC133384397 isoform X2 [Rhineura floridana]
MRALQVQVVWPASRPAQSQSRHQSIATGPPVNRDQNLLIASASGSDRTPEDRYSQEFQRLPLDAAIHPFRPGDWVRIKTWKKETLQPEWSQPVQVLLTTDAALKIDGKAKWIHHTRVKKASAPIGVQEPGTGIAKDSPTGEGRKKTPEEKWLSQTVPGLSLKLHLRRVPQT